MSRWPIIILGIAIILLNLTVNMTRHNQDQKIQELNHRIELLEQKTDFMKDEIKAIPILREQAAEKAMIDEINDIAGLFGLKGQSLVQIARCESRLDPGAVGGRSGSFRGLYQWNKRSNPEITDKCAFDVNCSSVVTAVALKRGEAWRWPNC